jgi:hypothetical protein
MYAPVFVLADHAMMVYNGTSWYIMANTVIGYPNQRNDFGDCP